MHIFTRKRGIEVKSLLTLTIHTTSKQLTNILKLMLTQGSLLGWGRRFKNLWNCILDDNSFTVDLRQA